MKRAITLPQSAIYSVSAAGFHSTSENSHFGGHMRAKYSPMTGSAPATSAGRRFTPSRAPEEEGDERRGERDMR